jgi:acyl-CoA thioesterase I
MLELSLQQNFNKMIQKKIFYVAFSLLCIVACQQNSNKNMRSPSEVDKNEQQSVTEQKNIIFFGNSLTAAFGLNIAEGFAGRIEQRLDSLQMGYKVIHAGNSGETTAGGVSRVDWVISKQKPSIFVLELGGNDALRGFKAADTERNLQEIITKVKTKYPDCKILLAGMYAPTNMGKDYTRAFQAIYPTLAKQNNIALVPFLLEGVGGIAPLNLPDGIHPTAEGHRIVTENVWRVLKTML